MERDEYRKLFDLEDHLWWFVGMREISSVLAERFVRTQSESVDDSGTYRILDAGCGTGGTLASLVAKGTGFGIDCSREALGFARLRTRAPLVRGDVSLLPFASESFDLVTSLDVLYHQNVPNDVKALAEVARVLKPRGCLLVRVPALDRIRSRHDLAVHTRHRYGRKELEEKLQAAGLVPLVITYANCFLAPVALIRRLSERFQASKNGGSEIGPMPRWLNNALLRVLRMEARFLRRATLPIGLSLVAIARKLPASSGVSR